MKTKYPLFTLFILIVLTLQSVAQSTGNLHGIVRRNYYSTGPGLDSATIRLGYMNPVTGYVYNTGTATYHDAINLTGSALNPYENTFVFMGANDMNTFDLTTGNLINQVPLSNPLGDSYFDNFRFNNSDSTLYGLARRNTYNPSTGTTVGSIYLATADPQTGIISEISPVSVAQGYALACSAIDPYQMVYYFSTGATLMGLDMYTGTIYNQVPFTFTDGMAFDNFTYSCADTALYGLVRQNYYSWVPSSFFPGDSMMVFDSATLKLGRVDLYSGVVTTISPVSITQGGYSLNAGSAIDPFTMTYYYSTGSNLIGVSLITGLLTSNVPYTFADGDFFDMMRTFDNCYSAATVRPNPLLTGINSVLADYSVVISPNPASESVHIQSDFVIRHLELITIEGKVVLSQNPDDSSVRINVESIPGGFYFVRMFDKFNQQIVRKIRVQ